ncbi:MAG: hypothetical protein HC920_16130 [Oscillatoriales cyanobacterium SM2_3_0]|nr:hypothetical protein [Oscillatoriales cyanobacterium SM2_3_0]
MTISTILKNLSLVTVGAVAVTFGFGEAANAVALTGSFQFNGIGDPISQVVITANKLNFSPNPTPIGLAAQTDSFTSFSSGFVRDVNSVAGLNGSPTLLSNVPFLDLGENDGIDILKLTEVSEYTFVNLGVTTAINLAYKGFLLVRQVTLVKPLET